MYIPFMDSQVILNAEAFGAFLTHEGSLLTVSLAMLLQSQYVVERLTTLVANKWPSYFMESDMLLQVGFVNKALVAGWANVGSLLRMVAHFVQIQVSFGAECFQAFLAFKGLLWTVAHQMFLQVVLTRYALLTDGAGMNDGTDTLLSTTPPWFDFG